MKDFLTYLICGAVTGAVVWALPTSPPLKQSCECRCDCYWRGKEDGRIEVRKANAELLKKQANEQEWPEATEKPWWADMPAVN